jgi:hypothetical protein
LLVPWVSIGYYSAILGGGKGAGELGSGGADAHLEIFVNNDEV